MLSIVASSALMLLYSRIVDVTIYEHVIIVTCVFNSVSDSI